jgi:hypothetical protein
LLRVVGRRFRLAGHAVEISGTERSRPVPHKSRARQDDRKAVGCFE